MTKKLLCYIIDSIVLEGLNMEFIENKEEEQKQLNGIFKDMLKYSPSKIVGTLGNAIIVPVYTSLLPPEQYGIYSLSIAFLSFLCIIFSDWVGLSGLRFFRQHQLAQDLSKYLSVLVSILAMNICTMFVLCVIFQNYFCNSFKIHPKYFFAVLFLIIPVAIRALLFQLLRAQLKSTSYTFSTILNQFMTIGFSIFFIKFFHMGAIAMLLAMGISISLTDLLLIYQSKIYIFFKKPKLQWSVLLPIAMYGIPIAATSLSTWIINQSNKFIMNNINGFKDVAYVGVAYSVTLPLLMTIFSIITIAIVPRVIRMYEAKIDVRHIISRFIGYYLLISIPIVTIMAIYPSDFVSMLANQKFHQAYRLIPYFAFGTFFMGLADYTTLQYHLANKTYIEFIIKLLSGLLNVALTIKLIPILGLDGVGIATLTANFLYFFLSTIIVLPKLGVLCPIKQLFRILVSFVPFYLLYKHMVETNSNIPAGFQMLILLGLFYAVYFVIYKLTNRKKADA